MAARVALRVSGLDRIGKGIRGAPRDALIADLTPEVARGASYGLRQALDTAGAVAGPLLAIGLMVLFAGDFRAVFWVAVAPAAVAFTLVVVGVEERAAPAAPAQLRAPLRRADLRLLGGAYWSVLAAAAVASWSGLALLVASAAAGFLWEAFGPRATFLAGATLAGLALGGVVLARKWVRKGPAC